MQNRRSFLITVSSLSFGSVAGCLESENGEGAEQSYEDALVHLDQNAETLDEFAGKDDIPDEFNDGEIHRRADSAEEHLAEAEDAAADDQQDHIQNAQAISQYHRSAADYNALLVEFNNCFDTVDAYTEADRFEAANDELATCRETYEDVKEQHDTVESTHSEIDPDLADEEAQLEHEKISANLQIDGEELETMDAFLRGLQQFMEGSVTIFQAFESYTEENFDDAERQFRAAEEEFDESETTFALLEADPDTPQQIKPDVIELHCSADAFHEASEHYADSVTEASNKNWNQADQYAKEGETALDKCE